MGIIWNLFMQLWKHRDRKFLEANYLLFWVNKKIEIVTPSESLSDVSQKKFAYRGNRCRNDLLLSRETFAYIPG